jgi:hypothetical protein
VGLEADADPADQATATANKPAIENRQTDATRDFCGFIAGMLRVIKKVG